MIGFSTRSLSILTCCGFALCTLFLLGCETEINRRYGRSNDKSINGYSAFANLLRERGHDVGRETRITKRLNNYQTIFWAPDIVSNPPENLVSWLENWLAQDSDRVLIYVGNGYRGNLDFYRNMVQNSPIEERETWKRELAESLINEVPFYDFWQVNDETFWFEEDDSPTIESRRLGGPWADSVDDPSLELETKKLLKPIDYSTNVPEPYVDPEAPNAYYSYEVSDEFRDSPMEVTDLLTVDENPFAFCISPESSPGQRLIVISNGSFLINLSLIDSEKQKLASRVADECIGDVVFLDSGAQWPVIGGRGNDPKLAWSWIAQPPMNYIVPHFLFWGVLYCFVYFPNFGRPRRLKFHPPKSFSKHIQAVGEILRRSKEHSWARQRIDEYLKRNSNSKN
jgi:hypothetical protein